MERLRTVRALSSPTVARWYSESLTGEKWGDEEEEEGEILMVVVTHNFYYIIDKSILHNIYGYIHYIII